MSSRRWIVLPILTLLTAPLAAWNLQDVDWDKAASGSGKLFKAAAGMSDADEIKLGREVAANLAARYGLVEDAAQVKYVNLVGQSVAQRSSRPTLPYHFGILRSKEFNAFAAPGGYIFVTQGLLGFLKDEAELAGVLAHEMSHVTERHIVKAIRQANLLGAGKDLAAATGHDMALLGTLSDFSIHLLDKGLSRKDELEADRLGTQLAAKAGYDPRGLSDSVQRLAALQGNDPILARFHNTHPPVNERLKTIDQALKKTNSAPDAPRLADRYMQQLAASH